MPRAVCVNKELLNLKTVGGRGCHPISNDSPPWMFPVLSRSSSMQFVTPADNSSLLECTDDAGSDSADDSNSWSGSEDEDIAFSEDSSYVLKMTRKWIMLIHLEEGID